MSRTMIISTNGDWENLAAYQSSVCSLQDRLISWVELPMAFQRSSNTRVHRSSFSQSRVRQMASAWTRCVKCSR